MNKKGITPCKRQWMKLVTDDNEDGLVYGQGRLLFCEEKGKRNDHREVKIDGA
jgi:hypothetical protein